MYKKRPWLKHYGEIPATIEYPRISLYEALMRSAARHTDQEAWDFFGKTQTYDEFARSIHNCANGLAALGLEAGDRMTIAMPTCPQGLIAFYAGNCLGAVANIIHPLASQKEIEYYLNISQSRIAITLDIYFPKFAAVRKNTPLKKIIIAKISDFLTTAQKVKFAFSKGFKRVSVPSKRWIVKWTSLFDPNHPRCVPIPTNTDALAVIIYSGGVTGNPKGILLSNQNLIAVGMMISAWGNFCRNDIILAIVPLSHGFGLGGCINATLMSGGKCILLPQFTSKMVTCLIRAKRPNIIIGLPNLFHALTDNSAFKKTKLCHLKAAYCGADTLPQKIKERFEKIVVNAGGNIRLQEGYGLAETVTMVMGNLAKEYRKGSIGIPFPDVLAKIVQPGTDEELPAGSKGELCLHGPFIMLGYLNQPEKTSQTVKMHRDSKLWLHTEELCSMDEDGYFYFHMRSKPTIKSSDLTVPKFQIEDRLKRHPDVLETCVIGIPDIFAVEKVKAFVVLKESQKAGADMVQTLIEYCRKELIKESCPLEIEFRPEIPKTLFGKIAYHELWQQEIQKLHNAGQYTGKSTSWSN
ncbi:MAG: AMP-binding protein [Desulfobacteraceae bacterium]|jgi:long-chain acyl-CoA synthetase